MLSHRHALRENETPQRRLLRHLAWGGALVAAGIALLLQRQGLLGEHSAWLILPGILAWSALVRLALERTASAVIRAFVRLAVAGWLVVVIEGIGGWTFESTWPVLLIAVGVGAVLRALFPRTFLGGCRPSW